MKKKIWSACIKKRYLLVIYIFSIYIVVSNETTIEVAPKGSDYYETKTSSHSKQRLYLFILFSLSAKTTKMPLKQRIYFRSCHMTSEMDVVELNHMLTVYIILGCNTYLRPMMGEQYEPLSIIMQIILWWNLLSSVLAYFLYMKVKQYQLYSNPPALTLPF